MERNPGVEEWLEALGGMARQLFVCESKPVDDQAPSVRVQHFEAMALETTL
jgi:hypothetical protein